MNVMVQHDEIRKTTVMWDNASIDICGRLLIPRYMRTQLNIFEGSKLKSFLDGDRLLISLFCRETDCCYESRAIDSLGRYVIPKKMRQTLAISDCSSVYLRLDDNGNTIICQVNIDSCIYCESKKGLRLFNQKFVCLSCINELIQLV